LVSGYAHVFTQLSIVSVGYSSPRQSTAGARDDITGASVDVEFTQYNTRNTPPRTRGHNTIQTI